MRKIRVVKVTAENCLANKLPGLAREWHPTKNGKLTPNDVLRHSKEKVWWKCLNGHEWISKIANRSECPRCPYCLNLKIYSGNSLATLNPELAKEWHPTKNGKLMPNQVGNSAHKVVWWTCGNGHEWKASIRSRSARFKTGCPYCANQMVCVDNCLATTHPELLTSWHPTKNGILTLNNVAGKSNKYAWWKCEKNHEWESRIADRIVGNGCPYCDGKKVCEDNCLLTSNPKLSTEWHPTLNGRLSPRDVVKNSNKKSWWRCKEGHEWRAVIGSRNARGIGCPFCNKISLKDGAILSSLPEAIKYMEYKRLNLVFEYNAKYHDSFGVHRYDFYFPLENKYTEVTSYNKKSLSNSPGRYFCYLRNIVKKRRFVENVLKSKFEFIQFIPTKEQIKTVRENMK